MTNQQPREIGVDIETERWVPVRGFEGLYEVSDLGRVRSLDRIDRRGCRRGGKVLRGSTVSKYGYLSIPLCDAPVRSRRLVHRIVLESFVGPCPPGMEGCHGDGDTGNNRLANLRWGTRSENNRDIVRHGNHVNARKTHCPRSHPYDEENTYLARRGSRGCRACDRARRRVSA